MTFGRQPLTYGCAAFLGGAFMNSTLYAHDQGASYGPGRGAHPAPGPGAAVSSRAGLYIAQWAPTGGVDQAPRSRTGQSLMHVPLRIGWAYPRNIASVWRSCASTQTARCDVASHRHKRKLVPLSTCRRGQGCGRATTPAFDSVGAGKGPGVSASYIRTAPCA